MVSPKWISNGFQSIVQNRVQGHQAGIINDTVIFLPGVYNDKHEDKTQIMHVSNPNDGTQPAWVVPCPFNHLDDQ